MKELSKEQIEFFETLKDIQDNVVNIALCNNTDDIENTLYDVTYETIYRMMELFDGYVKDSIKIELVDVKSGQSISDGIQLHDMCVDFITYRKDLNAHNSY